MAKPKRKLTAAERAARKKRRKEFMTIFINGKQKRVKRPPTIEGLPEDEFIRRNADPIWLHQNEMWELIEEEGPPFPLDDKPIEIDNLFTPMTRQILERDWKVFKELRNVALERLCDKILQEAKRQLEESEKTAHEKYLNLHRLLKKRDNEVARVFNDFRRSTAIMQIGIIHKMGLLTDEELRRFSPETIQMIEMLGSL